MFFCVVLVTFVSILFVEVHCNTGQVIGSKTKDTVKSLLEQSLSNKTYVDIPDNPRLLPAHLDEYQPKEKKIKKNPKRTIQKIIKKNRAKKRYFNPVSNKPLPTLQEKSIEEPIVTERVHIQTQPPIIRRRIKHQKPLRYPMPFQKLQKRTKRELERDNLVLMKDLDEMKIVKDSNGDDVVSVHFKKYW